MRAPYNVLVIPYTKVGDKVNYCIFRREDMEIWQFIAGGGEDNEDYLTAAKRETREESGIDAEEAFYQLESMCYVPSDCFSEKARKNWGEKYVIPVYCFAVMVQSTKIVLSQEHLEYKWCSYEDARELLHFDLDKTALYELHERIKYEFTK